MGATHSHVCRAHSLFKLSYLIPRPSEICIHLLRARIHAVLFGNSGGFREDFSFKMQYLEIRLKREAKRYEITIGRAVRRDLGKLLKRCFHSEPRRIGLISNKRVFGLYGKE